MNKYKQLEQMGVQNPEQIARFTVYTVNNADILRIIYDRKRGSLLPVSRRYKFNRIKKSTLVDSGTRKTEIIYESAPEFRSAVSELNKIMRSKDASADVRKLINEEVRLLEEEVSVRLDYIKTLVKKL